MSAVAFVLLGLTLTVAAGDWLATARGDPGLGYLCRPLVLLLLVMVALEVAPDDSNATAWIVMALLLSLVGDVLLLFDRNQMFVGALAIFVAAHLAYVGGMLFLGIDVARVLVGAVVAALAMLAVGRRILVGVRRRHPALVQPVQAYIGVASAMAVTAFAVGRPVGVLGAGLFSAADAMGGWNRFVRSHSVLPLATTVAYQLGQIGLVLSLA